MGCGSSFVTFPLIVNKKNTSNDNSDRLPPIIPRVKTRKSSENFEPFTLVYLDDDSDENDQEFRSIINYLRCFNDIETCEEFIQSNNNKHDYLFFIVSSQYASNIVSHIHDSTQIIGIYILQQNEDFIDRKWTKRYSKVKGLYLGRDGLLEELSSDVKIYQTIGDLLPITVYSRSDNFQTNNNSSIDHLCFLFYQLFIHEYCLNSSSITKTDLLEIIEDYYRSNTYESEQITEFIDKYQPKKNILKWFLRETFVQRLLTKSLLTLNLKILFSLRFFIKDMFKTMNDLISTKSPEQIYYRSQILSSETFGRIKSNPGELLSINNFFLANKNRSDSLASIRQYKSSSRILFEIKIPSDFKHHKHRPFIELPSDKNKILFFIGSIFRLNTIVFDMNNDCWIIQMTFYDERINNDFEDLFSFLKNENNSITLANLLRQISPKSAEDFYQHLLKENSESFSKLQCYRGLGLCSYSRDDYGQALIYFEKALQMKTNDQLIRSSLHNSIGLVYAQQDEIDQAHIHFSEALKSSSSPLHSACVHHNLALISSRKGLYDEELDHYQEAFQIRTEQLPANHLQLASLYNNIGIAHSDMHQYDQALSNLRKALEMRLKLLSDSHVDVARSYANIGTVYARTQELQMALEYFTKAQLLFEKQSNICEQDLNELNKNIKIINDKLRRKTC